MTLKYAMCLFGAALLPLSVLADGLTLGGTRLIYDAAKKEASIALENRGKSTPQLVQTWVSDKNRNTQAIPFVTTPPVSKLGQNDTIAIRVVYVGQSLPNDRETQFQLNVRAVPATERKNNPQRMVIATQNIIKLIYRPVGLTSEAASRAGESLKVNSVSGGVRFDNPTPYVVSLASVVINGKKVERPGTIQPYSQLLVPSPAGTPSTVIWRTINDFGGITQDVKFTF
ncbi:MULTISPECIES: molecular chaperone [Enterobacteriaceae]|uniref:Molecular chaperone n=1 Tax=Raoultella lignicola TaxID=3040939 RepID=A0ABU9FGM3_9ENTR|nr:MULTISPECIES: molecular chaperone [Enterobacteriaceae]MRT48059.1 fimbria/pilus periplasmic chaperone [Raoultella sp. RIT712]QNK05872.1 molecular chaperone [Enterobacter sp. JUb54]ROS13388.1 P pilus assembly chaperone PapD [Raoultella sp. BIGb0399]